MIYGYARVSTYRQAKDGNSLEAQEKELRKNETGIGKNQSKKGTVQVKNPILSVIIIMIIYLSVQRG